MFLRVSTHLKCKIELKAKSDVGQLTCAPFNVTSFAKQAANKIVVTVAVNSEMITIPINIQIVARRRPKADFG